MTYNCALYIVVHVDLKMIDAVYVYKNLDIPLYSNFKESTTRYRKTPISLY